MPCGRSIADDRWLASLGSCLVIAPHPDDESIGCGGLLALLCRAGVEVQVVLLSDGTMSHPGSQAFPAAARRAVRESEMRQALACLGVSSDRLRALGYPDGRIPSPPDAGFEAAAEAISEVASVCRAHTLIAPWRRDPHADHRAANTIARRAALLAEPARRLVEYVVWMDERGTAGDWPHAAEATARDLDISNVLPLKLAAIRAHRSQLGQVFTDDPAGFVLSRAMLERSARPVETYFESPGVAKGR